MAPRFTLIQCRNIDDPVRGEELLCFSERLGVPAENIRAVDLLRDPMDSSLWTGVDAVLVGGSGDYSVLDPEPQIRRFIDVLVEIVDRGFPMFASCFGFQALAMGLGGEVIRDPANAEVGTYTLSTLPEASDDPLFSALPASFDAQLGHTDRASALSDRAIPLARSAAVPYQALKVKGAPVYAT